MKIKHDEDEGKSKENDYRDVYGNNCIYEVLLEPTTNDHNDEFYLVKQKLNLIEVRIYTNFLIPFELILTKFYRMKYME